MKSHDPNLYLLSSHPHLSSRLLSSYPHPSHLLSSHFLSSFHTLTRQSCLGSGIQNESSFPLKQAAVSNGNVNVKGSEHGPYKVLEVEKKYHQNQKKKKDGLNVGTTEEDDDHLFLTGYDDLNHAKKKKKEGLNVDTKEEKVQTPSHPFFHLTFLRNRPWRWRGCKPETEQIQEERGVSILTNTGKALFHCTGFYSIKDFLREKSKERSEFY
ncbi:hypothetical protein PanWU01x14_005230, partial [Parasponia andersonii]